jgi:hypothetical protein
MRALSNADFLSLWERGEGLHLLDQSLLALGAGLPDMTYDALADWPLGWRNRALAELHCSSFGANLRGWASCAQCTERLEFVMDLRVLANGGQPPRTDPIVVNGQTFRLPTVRDLAVAAQQGDLRFAVIRLIEGCRTEADQHQADLSEEAAEKLEEQMALADPLAETTLDLRCSACGHQWSETLDIGSFLWAEINARVHRLLREVHTLAAAYSWSEEEILSLSDRRRAAYLEMLHA